MFDPLVTVLYNKGEMDTAGNRKSLRSNRHVRQNRFIYASKATAPDKKVGKLGRFFPPLPGLRKGRARGRHCNVHAKKIGKCFKFFESPGLKIEI